MQVNDRLLWPKGRKKAFTLSYDDGVTQDIRLIEILNKYGVKATFNINSGFYGEEGKLSGSKKEVSHDKLTEEEVAIHYKGHELATHGQYHKSMVGMDMARCVEEIIENRKDLEKIEEKAVRGHAYAYGAYDEDVIKALEACGISYARTIESTHKFEIPQNFLKWHPTCHHDDEKVDDLVEEFLSDDFYFSYRTSAKLLYIWGHSYEFDQYDNWHHIEDIISKIGGRDDVWYATNGQIRDYVEAHSRLIYTVDSKKVYNPSTIPVYLGGTFTNDNKYIEVLPGQLKETLA